MGKHLRDIVDERDRRYEQMFESQRMAVNAALAAADRAVLKAELAAEKRFESVNEFRNTLSDQQRTLMPRTEVERIESALNEKYVMLSKQMDDLLSERKGIKGGWGYAVGVIGFILMALAFAMQFK